MEFLKEKLLLLVSFCGSIALILSITYNFGYFGAIDILLLERLSVSDYISSALPVVFPSVFGFVLIEIIKIYLFGKNNECAKDKVKHDLSSLEKLKIKITKLKIIYIFSNLIMVLLFLAISLAVSEVNIFSILIPILIVVFLHISLGFLSVAEKVIEAKVVNMIYSFLLLIILTSTMGFLRGKETLLAIPTTAIVYQGIDKVLSSHVQIIKVTAEEYIFLEEESIRIIAKDKVFMVSIPARCPDGYYFRWLYKKHDLTLKKLRPHCYK